MVAWPCDLLTPGIEKLQQLLERICICRVAKKSAFSSHMHEAFGLQFVEVMRERRIGDIELFLNLTDDQGFSQAQPSFARV